MQVRDELDHVMVTLPLRQDGPGLVGMVGQLIGVLGLVLLLGWPLVGIAVIALGALVHWGQQRWPRLLLALYPEVVTLRFQAAQIDAQLGRRRLTIVPLDEEITIHHDPLASHRLLRLRPQDGKPVELAVVMSLEDEKQLWTLIDAATKSARGRSGLGERDVPASLQQTLRQ